MSVPIRLRCFEAPPSGKNSQRLWIVNCPQKGRCGAVPRVSKSNAAVRVLEEIRDALRAAVAHEPALGRDEVRVVMSWHSLSNVLDVSFESLGPEPPTPTGRTRDLHNIPDVVLDAAQGIIFANDNQVSELLLRRCRD